MNLSRANSPVLHFDDLKGKPLVGGKLYTYVNGVPGKKAVTYKDKNGTLNTNPIILNLRGECEVWLDPSVTYDFELKDLLGVTIWHEEGITTNVKTFSAVGSSTISTEESTVDGKTIVTFKVKDGSIGFEELKDARHTIPDSHYLQFKRLNMNGSECIVVTLCETLKSWLATQGYTYDE